MSAQRRGSTPGDSLSDRLGRIPWNPPEHPAAPSTAIRGYLARLEDEARRVRRRAQELDETLALVRECLALLPGEGPELERERSGELPAPGARNERGLESSEPVPSVATRVVREARPGHALLPPLTVQLLGRFRIYRGGETLECSGGAKVWRILKFLVLREGGPVSRDVLADTFWRKSSARSAAQSVYSAIHTLRRALGADEGLDYITCTAGYYALAEGVRLATDVAAWRRGLATGKEAARRGDVQRATAALEEALQIYRGPLLTDEPYERWATEEREVLARQHLDALELLARLYEERGQEERAADVHRRLVVEDALRESSHRALIRHQLQSGRRAEALRQYRTLAEALEQELGVEPEPATRRLVDELLPCGRSPREPVRGFDLRGS